MDKRVTDTTLSPLLTLNKVTPWVFLDAIRISLTGDLIILPASVTNMICSSFFTGKESITVPLRSEVSIFIMPWPPLLVILYSYAEVLLP